MKKLVNTEEMAEILDISYDAFKKIYQRDSLVPRVKVSKKALRFKPNDVVSYFENKKVDKK